MVPPLPGGISARTGVRTNPVAGEKSPDPPPSSSHVLVLASIVAGMRLDGLGLLPRCDTPEFLSAARPWSRSYTASGKRIPKPVHGALAPAVLVQDDLAALFDLFAKVAHDVRMTIAGHELSDPVDLYKLPAGQVRDLEISGMWPPKSAGSGVRVALFTRRGGFQFYLSDREDLEAQGLRAIVEDRLREREIPEARHSTWISTALSFSALLGAVISATVPRAELVTLTLLALGVSIATIGSLSSLRNVRVLLTRAGTVYLGPIPPASASFVQRNWDSLAITVIEVVGGGIVALLVLVIARALGVG